MGSCLKPREIATYANNENYAANPLQEAIELYNPLCVISDYYFLEDVGRFVDSTQRDQVWKARETNDSQQRRRNVSYSL